MKSFNEKFSDLEKINKIEEYIKRYCDKNKIVKYFDKIYYMEHPEIHPNLLFIKKYDILQYYHELDKIKSEKLFENSIKKYKKNTFRKKQNWKIKYWIY